VLKASPLIFWQLVLEEILLSHDLLLSMSLFKWIYRYSAPIPYVIRKDRMGLSRKNGNSDFIPLCDFVDCSEVLCSWKLGNLGRWTKSGLSIPARTSDILFLCVYSPSVHTRPLSRIIVPDVTLLNLISVAPEKFVQNK